MNVLACMSCYRPFGLFQNILIESCEEAFTALSEVYYSILFVMIVSLSLLRITCTMVGCRMRYVAPKAEMNQF